jgi:hypothetical protein
MCTCCLLPCGTVSPSRLAVSIYRGDDKCRATQVLKGHWPVF